MSYRNTGNSNSQNNSDKIFNNAGDVNNFLNDDLLTIVKQIILSPALLKILSELF